MGQMGITDFLGEYKNNINYAQAAVWARQVVPKPAERYDFYKSWVFPGACSQ